MPKILVTGGAGNVGGSLACALASDDRNQVVVVDNFVTSGPEKLPPLDDRRFHFIKADVNQQADIAAIMQAHRFDYVFHYAALVGVKRTLSRPIDVLNDIHGIENVLRLAKNTGVKRVFYSSSSEVYGEPVEFPQNEDTTPLNSRLPYAVVKNVGESFFRSFHREYGLDFTIFRFFNTYGPRQSTDFVISKFVDAALRGEDITIYGDGSQTRTFCYIDDNVDCTRACLYEGHALNEVLNVGSDTEITIKELARFVVELTRSSSRIIHLPALEEGDMTRRQPDISKMRAILGRPLTPLSDGIMRVVERRTQLLGLAPVREAASA
jgi:UDP-glucuronate decarboxylase